jgi:methylmalonyl-CoA carboxyltransferase 12S subunit
MDELVEELHARKKHIALGGGEQRIAKHHAAHKLTARERIEALVDPGTFQEIGAFYKHRCTQFGMAGKDVPADGVVTGCAMIGGRLVHLASQDFTVAGGSAGEVHCGKIVEMMRQSMKTGSPFIFINDSGGARVQEGINSLAGYARVFYNNTMLSGAVPQISIICGPCAGGAAYSPALTDFIIQTRQGHMFITGPSVIKQVTGEVVTADDLGGPYAQMKQSGVSHVIADDDVDALASCRKLLSFLPSNNSEDPPRMECSLETGSPADLVSVVPTNQKIGYDVRDVIARVVDNADFFEIHSEFAMNMVVCFARIMGRPVGVVANQPSVLAGAIDINASDKAARFVRFCNAFNVPIVTFVDAPGYLPGVEQEYGGIIRHGAKLLFAYSAATVPKLTVVLRKAYGGAYIAMCSKELGADRVFAWPTAQIAVMGAEGAAEIVFRHEIDAAEDKAACRERVIAKYRDAFSNPYVPAECGLVDAVIEPAETRRCLAMSLEALLTKRELRPPKKHGLIPL